MNKYIVCVFDNEKTAYAGAKAVRELENEGSLAVFEAGIISKNEAGVVQLKSAEADGPVGTVGGLFLGSLVGILGGPVGVAVGAAAGSLGGLLVDAYRAGVNDRFADEIAAELTPGKHALVAEVEEGWTMPLDTRMSELGVEVHRGWRIDVEDEQLDRDVEATQREYAELKEEWNQAKGEAKAKLQAKVEAAQAKLKALDDRLKQKAESMKQQVEAKLKKLDDQIAKASADIKQKYEKAKTDLQADCQQRSAKLKQAGQLTAQALS